MYRLRIKFARGDEVKYISHLDITRVFQRAFLRAGLPLAYSQGFNPHPRISLAAPLPVGATAEAELMDIMCERPVTAEFFMESAGRELPDGIQFIQAVPVPLSLPSLQAQLGEAEYLVTVATDKTRSEIENEITKLLALSTLPWQHERDTGVRHYDLRTLISDIRLVDSGEGRAVLAMRLRADEKGAGRPEQVSLALGFKEYPLRIHRRELILRGT